MENPSTPQANPQLVLFDVELPCGDTFTRCFACPADWTPDRIARDILDEEGEPAYYVGNAEAGIESAVRELTSGGSVRRDYFDGMDYLIFGLTIVPLSPEEHAFLRRVHLV